MPEGIGVVDLIRAPRYQSFMNLHTVIAGCVRPIEIGAFLGALALVMAIGIRACFLETGPSRSADLDQKKVDKSSSVEGETASENTIQQRHLEGPREACSPDVSETPPGASGWQVFALLTNVLVAAWMIFIGSGLAGTDVPNLFTFLFPIPCIIGAVLFAKLRIRT